MYEGGEPSKSRSGGHHGGDEPPRNPRQNMYGGEDTEPYSNRQTMREYNTGSSTGKGLRTQELPHYMDKGQGYHGSKKPPGRGPPRQGPPGGEPPRGGSEEDESEEDDEREKGRRDQPPWMVPGYFPPWYTTLPPPQTVMPSSLPSRKSLPYPLYQAGTDPDAHIRVFKKAIRANRETEDDEMINLFCYTLRDAVSEWGENFLNSYPGCNFEMITKALCKRYRKVQTDEQVYMALRAIKQTESETVESYFERLIKLTNCLQEQL